MISPIIEAEGGSAQQVEIDRLQMNIQCRLNGRVQDFRLLPHAEGLILRGIASTYHAKQLAQHLVMRTTFLPILVNEIAVEFACDVPPIFADC